MFTQDFTDPQGVTHIGAVFEVCDTSLTTNTNSRYRLELESDNPVDVSNNFNNNLRYRMYYWIDQDARDSGKLPYILANTDPLGEWFTASGLSTTYIGDLSAHDLTEKHCKEFILV